MLKVLLQNVSLVSFYNQNKTAIKCIVMTPKNSKNGLWINIFFKNAFTIVFHLFKIIVISNNKMVNPTHTTKI